MTDQQDHWTTEDARKYLEATFANPSSKSYLRIDRVYPEVEEIVQGRAFRLKVGHEESGMCAARLYRGLGSLGGDLWLQEVRALLRLSAHGSPALPKVMEGHVREEKKELDSVGVVVSESSNDPLTLEYVHELREDPILAIRWFTLGVDALRRLHLNGMLHRNIWRESFEVVQPDQEEVQPSIRLTDFEMSAFLSSLIDPIFQNSDDEFSLLDAFRKRGGIHRYAFCPREAINFGFTGNEIEELIDYRSDVYSLGVCAFEWLVDDLPIKDHWTSEDGIGNQDAHRSFRDDIDQRIGAATHLSDGLRDLLRGMISLKPGNRPTTTQITNDLARHYDDYTKVWRKQGSTMPYLVTMAPEHAVTNIQREESQDLSSNPETLFRQLKQRIQKDLVNSILMYSPNGALDYIRTGTTEGLKRAIWILKGTHAVYFCEEYFRKKGIKQVHESVDWALHIRYSIGINHATDFKNTAFHRRVDRVDVAHHLKDDEILSGEAARNRPSWKNLMREVRYTVRRVPSHHSFLNGFTWWLKVHTAKLGVHRYPFKRIPISDPHSPTFNRRQVRLTLNLRLEQHWIESDPLRHLISGIGKPRPWFGDFFDTLEERNLGELVTWDSDRNGRPKFKWQPNARAKVIRRIDTSTIDIEVLGTDFPPDKGWLRPKNDIASDFLVKREAEALISLRKRPDLVEHLYKLCSFKGPGKPWEKVGKGLEKPGPETVKRMLQYIPIFALQGPPGTGKTTIVTVALSEYIRKYPSARLLVSAQSHYALDELLSRFVDETKLIERDDLIAVRVAAEEGKKQIRPSLKWLLPENQAAKTVEDITRQDRKFNAGLKSDCSPKLFEIFARWKSAAGKSLAEIQDRLWQGANLVFSTTGVVTDQMLWHLSDLDTFDWVIVEEAAKAWPNEMIIPLLHGYRWTLIGDHMQLPPYGDLEIKKLYESCLQSDRQELRELVDDNEEFMAALWLFHRYFERDEGVKNDDGMTCKGPKNRTYQGQGERPAMTLNKQFRMHQSIATIISKAFYPKNPLDTADDLKTDKPLHGLAKPSYLRNRSVVWVDTGRIAECRHEEPHWRNLGEAKLVAMLVKEMTRAYETVPKRLKILSPYHYQNQAIVAELDPKYHRLVQTCDSFQGQQSEIVIVSLVRTNDVVGTDAIIYRIGHLASEERTNVLLSRAQHLLVIVGDFNHFKETFGTHWTVICKIVEDLRGVVRPNELSDLL